MSLRWRQRRAFRQRMTIYRLPGTVVARDVPCLFWTDTQTPMVNVMTQTQAVAKVTPDKVTCEDAVDLQSGDVVKQVSGGKRDGRFWEVRGEPDLNEAANEQTADLSDAKRTAAWMT